MYEFIWRHLPGPTWFRVIEALALTVLVVLGLFEFVFPWANKTSTFAPIIANFNLPNLLK